jgi:hypothetical protein
MAMKHSYTIRPEIFSAESLPISRYGTHFGILTILTNPFTHGFVVSLPFWLQATFGVPVFLMFS